MFDNTNFAWIEDMRADPESLPTIGHMLRDLGYYTAYKGKWHESEFAEGNTKDAMEPFGFSDFQEWGDAQGMPLDGLKKDPRTAAEQWLTERAPEIGAEQPWFLTVNKEEIGEDKALIVIQPRAHFPYLPDISPYKSATPFFPYQVPDAHGFHNNAHI